MIKLKKCPFCGSHKTILLDSISPEKEFYGHCTTCFASTDSCKSMIEAAKKWNIRYGIFSSLARIEFSKTYFAYLIINLGVNLIPKKFRTERLLWNSIKTGHIKVK